MMKDITLGILSIIEKLLNIFSFFKVENKTLKEIKRIESELNNKDLDDNVRRYNKNKKKQLVNGLSFYDCVNIDVDVISEAANILDYSKKYNNANGRLNLLLKNYHIVNGKLTRIKNIPAFIDMCITNIFILMLLIYLIYLLTWSIFGSPFDLKTGINILIQTIVVFIMLFGIRKISVSYFELKKFDILLKKYHEGK